MTSSADKASTHCTQSRVSCTAQLPSSLSGMRAKEIWMQTMTALRIAEFGMSFETYSLLIISLMLC
jgi:hypothetical protein